MAAGASTGWDRDVERLLTPRPSLGLALPAYDGRSIPNVAASVALAAGLDAPAPGPPLAPPLAGDLDPFGGRRVEGPILVLLVDGFGGASFRRWVDAGGAAARRWGKHGRPVTTVFPTTTTAALTALSTATPPSENGVVGYRQYLPGFGLTADLLHMSPVGVPGRETLVGPAWRPSMISAAPALFARGLSGVAVSRAEFEGTGLTRMLYEGAGEYVGYSTGSDLAHHLTKVLGRASPPRVVYAYWDELDTVQHLRGPSDSLFGFEADRLAHLLEYVAQDLGADPAGRVTVLVTADHGQVPYDPSAELRLDRVPEVARELTRPLGGDRRSPYFAARAGRVEPLRRALEAALPPGSRLVASRDAIEGGWYGPPPFHPELEDRIGDLIALLPSPYGASFRVPGAGASGPEFHGAHGGLDPAELIVPLVAGSLEDLGGTSSRGGGEVP